MTKLKQVNEKGSRQEPIFKTYSSHNTISKRSMPHTAFVPGESGLFLNRERLQDLLFKEKETELLTAIFEYVPAGVVYLDPFGIVQRANKKALEFLEEPLLGESWVSIIARAFKPQHDDGCDVSLYNGRRVSIDIHSIQEPAGQIVVLYDQTEKRAYHEKASRQERLLAMGKMLASLAHQLRTPLSAAILHASHLTKPNLSDEQRDKFTHKILARLYDLEQQISDLLFFARGGNPILTACALDQMVKEIASRLVNRLQESEVSLLIDNQVGELLLACNEISLKGAIENLIINAIEASPRFAKITLRLALLNGEVVISVIDKGIGIEKEQFNNIKKPFYSTKSNGTGLGLAVVDAVVNAHHGRLEMTSVAMQGTTVNIILPLQ